MYLLPFLVLEERKSHTKILIKKKILRFWCFFFQMTPCGKWSKSLPTHFFILFTFIEIKGQREQKVFICNLSTMKMISLIRTVHRLIKIQIGKCIYNHYSFCNKDFLIYCYYLYITIKNEFVEVTSNGSTMKLISLIRTVQRLIKIQKR